MTRIDAPKNMGELVSAVSRNHRGKYCKIDPKNKWLSLYTSIYTISDVSILIRIHYTDRVRRFRYLVLKHPLNIGFHQYELSPVIYSHGSFKNCHPMVFC